MAEEVEIDQAVYDELIAAGKSERVARAKAKSAAVRKQKVAAGERVGPRSEEEQAELAAAGSGGGGAQAQAGGSPQAGGGGGVAVAERPAMGGMTPEERQRRVQEALAAKGNGAAAAQRNGGDTKYAGQAHTHRLLAMVPPSGIQQIKNKQEDKVYTWPHLLSSEFICLLAWTAGVAVFSAFVQAPLRELANPNLTPNPSKAPWYFLALQELLRYFPTP